jgi:hypothetical protein
MTRAHGLDAFSHPTAILKQHMEQNAWPEQHRVTDPPATTDAGGADRHA